MLQKGTHLQGFPYVIEEQLGEDEGGQSEVYLATRDGDNQQVVIKIANVSDEDEDFYRAALENEVEILQRLKILNTSGIVEIYRVNPDARAGYSAHAPLYKRPPFCVLEYLPGGSLGRYLEQEGKIDLGTALRIAAVVADTLGQIHAKGFVHSDVKPENIIFRRQVTSTTIEPVLIDFGITRRIGQDGMIGGSSGWVAPERYLKKGEDPETVARPAPSQDVYSLGLLLFAMLTGELPFKGSSTRARLEAAPTKPSQHQLGIPPEIEALIMASITKDPAARPSAQDLAVGLRALFEAYPANPRPLKLRRRPARIRTVFRPVGTIIRRAVVVISSLAAILLVLLLIVRERPTLERLLTNFISPSGSKPFLGPATPQPTVNTLVPLTSVPGNGQSTNQSPSVTTGTPVPATVAVATSTPVPAVILSTSTPVLRTSTPVPTWTPGVTGPAGQVEQ